MWYGVVGLHRWRLGGEREGLDREGGIKGWVVQWESGNLGWGREGHE